MPSDGSNYEPELLLKSPHPKWLRAWSHRTEELIFDQGPPSDIVAVQIHGEREPRAVVQTKGGDGLAALSNDGRWLAYASDVTTGGSRKFEVWVQPYPGPGAPMRVSINGGMEPVWGPGDRELYYLKGDKMMAARVFTDPDFRFEASKVLFESSYSHSQAPPTYDVGSDGRFLMIKPVAGEESGATELIVVLNWFKELERLVPTK